MYAVSSTMKKVVVAVLVVVLVVAVLVAGDKIGANVAASQISSKLQSQLRLPQQPTTQIKGEPFLTQWAGGHYDEIDVSLPSLTSTQVGVQNLEKEVTVQNLNARMLNVTTGSFAHSQGDVANTTAGSVELSGTVPYSSLPIPEGLQASSENNRVKVTGTTELRGVSAPVTGYITPKVENNKVIFAPQEVKVGNTRLQAAAERALQIEIDVSNLPYKAQLTSVQVVPGGLRATASANNLKLSDLQRPQS
jgi:hypothetical protein